jgi:hypothetical protein
MSCKGTCKGETGNPKVKRYETGQKYCSECKTFLKIEPNRCPCCNELLRLKSRNNKGNNVWLKAY